MTIDPDRRRVRDDPSTAISYWLSTGADVATTPLRGDARADVAIIEATGPGDVFSHMSWAAAAALKKRHPGTRFLFNHLYSGTVRGAAKDLQVVEV